MFTLALGLAVAAPFPDLLEPAGMAAPNGAAAVVIGLEDYGFLPDVPYARRDAAVVRTMLTTSMGLDPQRVRTLTNGNREQILSAVDEMVAAAGAQPVVVWFSGHGATSATDGSMLLVGDDAKPQQDAFESRSVSVAQLTAQLPAGSLVVVDACAAGQGREGEELLPGARFAVPSWVAPQDKDVAVWMAAAPTELAEPYPEAKQGLFTAFAVGALRGWADTNDDGLVGLAEAHAYVERAFATLGARQSPTLTGADRTLSRATEASPVLGDLPAPGSVVSTSGDAVALDVLGSIGVTRFEPPFAMTKGQRVVDGTGRTLDLNALIEQERTEAIDRVVRQAQWDGYAFTTGTTLALTGATVAGVWGATSDGSPEDTAVIVGGAVGGLLAIPVAVLGARGLKRKQQKVVDLVNERYATP